MGKLFNFGSLMNAASGWARTGFGKFTSMFGGNAANGLTKAENTFLHSNAGQKLLSEGKTQEEILAAFKGVQSAQQANNIFGKVLKWGGLGGGAFLIGDAAINGQDSLAGKGLFNISDGAKKIDSVTDMNGLFTRVGQFFENLMKFFKNFSGIMSGDKKISDIFSDDAKADTTPPSANNDNDGPSSPSNDLEGPTIGNVASGYVAGRGLSFGVEAVGSRLPGLNRAFNNAGSHSVLNRALGNSMIGKMITLTSTFAGAGLETLNEINAEKAPTGSAPQNESFVDAAMHKGHVLAHGMQEGILSIGAAPEMLWDFADGLTGGALWGDHTQNSSARAISDFSDAHLIKAPELRDVFDHATHIAGNLGGLVVTGGAVGMGLKAAGIGAKAANTVNTSIQIMAQPA